MNGTATFSTDALSLSAVFAAWLAANPDVLHIDEKITLEGYGVRVQVFPTAAPVVSMPTGSMSVALDGLTVEVDAVSGSQSGERLLDFTVGATLTAAVRVAGDVLTLSGATGSIRFDGDRSELLDAVLDFVLAELVERYSTWPLPQLDRLLGLKASLVSAGTTDGELDVVVGMSCEPKGEPATSGRLVAPDESFHARVGASAQSALVESIIECVFEPVGAHKGLKVGAFGLEAHLEVSLTLERPDLRFEDGKIVGSGSVHATATINGKGPNERVSLSIGARPELADNGQKVRIAIQVPEQKVHLPIDVPGPLKLIKGLIEDGINELLKAVFKLLNKALDKVPITVFEAENPYRGLNLDVSVAFGELAVRGTDLVVVLEATAQPVPA